LEGKERKEIEDLDRFYIPESWYIQQLIEGGILGFIVFMSILFLIAQELRKKNILLL
jgi:hypothetical protein